MWRVEWTQRGQATMANSMPVVISSDQVMPLPTGAATEATLALIKAKTDNLDVALSTRTKPVDNQNVTIGDTESRDAFGRLRVSNPTAVFDSQFTYGLQPLLYEQITNGTWATITHDTTNRNVLLTFSSTPTGGKSYMQSYQHHRYQPWKSQLIRMTFNFTAQVANCLKFAGYSDGVNGIEFQNNGTTNQIVVYSGTGNGTQTVTQTNWNIDKLDGTWISWVTLDITKSQQLIIDMEALYTGRVRIGFHASGQIYYCHEFNFENSVVNPYIQNANLPVRCGMICTGTVSTTMKFQCVSIASEWWQERTIGEEFSQETATTLVAASGTRTHALSIRPKATFNGITNRASIYFIEINLLVTGANPVKWELCIGDVLTWTTTFNDVNTTYSCVEYNTAGTTSGAPAIVIDADYVISSGSGSNAGGQGGMPLTFRYPITLDAAGNPRSLGTLTLLVTGIGGTSACRAEMKWSEVK